MESIRDSPLSFLPKTIQKFSGYPSIIHYSIFRVHCRYSVRFWNELSFAKLDYTPSLMLHVKNNLLVVMPTIGPSCLRLFAWKCYATAGGNWEISKLATGILNFVETILPVFSWNHKNRKFSWYHPVIPQLSATRLSTHCAKVPCMLFPMMSISAKLDYTPTLLKWFNVDTSLLKIRWSNSSPLSSIRPKMLSLELLSFHLVYRHFFNRPRLSNTWRAPECFQPLGGADCSGNSCLV